MLEFVPSEADHLAQALRQASSKAQTISVVGHNSKSGMGGPSLSADINISTRKLSRILRYEPRDLTISVEAGMPFVNLQKVLAENGQMIALDPPFTDRATIGGVIATNTNGPMRRAFGTARDLVIGMSFALVNGDVAKTGGMVVKNVAGLDLGKLMIGSFGTLAVITSVNFRLHALAEKTETFLFSFSSLEPAIEKRNALLTGPLLPIAVDLLSPPASARFDRRGYTLAIRGGGSTGVLRRYANELSDSERLTESDDALFWRQIREFTPEFLTRQPDGVVLRISTTLSDLSRLLGQAPGVCISRAASGVTYVYLSSVQGAQSLWRLARQHGWGAIVEYAPDQIRNSAIKDSSTLWLEPSSTESQGCFGMMNKLKQMFDPQSLLNRFRLYGRI